MKRAIYRVPAGILSMLTPEQLDALQSVLAQYAFPMPGTIEHDGFALVDGVTQDNFDPAVMPALGMDWECLGLWQWPGSGPLRELVPLAADAMLLHLPDVVTYDQDGEVVDTAPPVLHVPHNWAGWPAIKITPT